MLKEIQEGERRIPKFVKVFSIALRLVRYWHSEFMFCMSEFIVRIYEYCKHSFQGFQFATKTPTSASEYGHVMADVGVYAFNGESIVFVMYIAHVPPWIDNIHITKITVRTIALCFWSGIDNLLYPIWRFVGGNGKTDDLSWLSADHSHNIGVFAAIASCFSFHEPIQFI